MILFAGCNISSSYNNDHIDPQTKKTIDQLNEQVVNGLKNNNPEEILAICSPKLAAIGKNDLYSIAQQVSGAFHTLSYKLEDQFLINNSSSEVMSSAISGMSGEHDYKIVFKALTKESIVTVGTFSDSIQTFALTTIYGKYGQDWKLNIMRIGGIRTFNMDAVDWYKMSKADLDAGHIVDAANKYIICTKLMKPANEWEYQKATEITEFGNILKQQINRSFTFPIEQNLNKKLVSIFYVNPEILQNGYFPLVSYVSTIPISDTLKLSLECDSLSLVIGNIFRGLDDNKAVIYRAYNKIPSSGTNEHYYSFVRWKK